MAETKRNQKKVWEREKAGRRRERIFHQEDQRIIKEIDSPKVSIDMLMSKSELDLLEQRIERLKKKLAKIGPMRPGSISKQYRDRKNQQGEYYQLSYTHKMRSRTEHVWPEHVKLLQRETAEYKKFKKLTAELVDLSIEISKARVALLREKGSNS
ncbi:MAG: DUF6788 family protein [Verrucomicrobiota bacterium]